MLANKLSINYTKTSYMIFSPEHLIDPRTHFDLFINNIKISRVSTTKFLGIHLDESLSGKLHIHELYLTLRKYIGIFYKLSLKMPPKTLKMLYFSFVYPNLLYGIEVYANTYLTYLHDLIILNNRILRILQHKPYNSNTSELYLSYNTLPIDKLFQFEILQHAHTSVFNPTTLPLSFQSNILFNTDVHNYFTRSRLDFHRAPSQSSHSRRISSNLSAKLWNGLPSNTKAISNHKLFQRSVREFLSSVPL